MIPSSTSRYILSALFVFAFAAAARAQMDAGFLGKRYVGASLFTENLRHQNISNGYGPELNGNLPLNSFLDATVKASYEKFNDYSISDRRFSGSLVGYADMETWKPFVELSLANTTQSSTTLDGIKHRSSDPFWSVGAGIEAPVTRSTAIFGVVTRNDYFDSKRNSYWTYKFGVNTWFTPKIGGVLSASFFENESVTYALGMTYRF
jgi:hypothetical protein